MNNNVTPIDLLPELEELEGPRQLNKATRHGGPPMSKYQETYGGDILPPGEMDRMNKFIRGNMNIPREAGMQPYHENFNDNEQMRASMDGTPSPMTIQQHNYYEPMNTSGEYTAKYSLPQNSPSCIDCANHVDACPICKAFFNNDKTVYIIAIVVLAIICLILLKKVLDV